MYVRRANTQDVQRGIDLPAYRVHFWKRPSSGEGHVYFAAEYELSGCRNVREALAWADENVGPDRTYTLYIAVLVGELRALVRLFGVDPTRHLDGREIDWPGQVYESMDPPEHDP